MDEEISGKRWQSEAEEMDQEETLSTSDVRQRFLCSRQNGLDFRPPE
jgi:hypothetical protein